MKFRQILFDLDGTLYSSKAMIESQIRPLMWSKYAEFRNFDNLEQARKELWQLILKYEHEAIGLQKEHGIDPIEFYTAVYSNIDLTSIVIYSDLKHLIKELSKKYDLYLMTNSSKVHVTRVLKYLDLQEFFPNSISFEDNEFRRKPDKFCYENFLRNYKINPAEVLTIDDSMINLYMSYNLGFGTCLVSNGLSDPPFFYEQHIQVEHLSPKFLDYNSYSITDFILKLL